MKRTGGYLRKGKEEFPVSGRPDHKSPQSCCHSRRTAQTSRVGERDLPPQKKSPRLFGRLCRMHATRHYVARCRPFRLERICNRFLYRRKKKLGRHNIQRATGLAELPSAVHQRTQRRGYPPHCFGHYMQPFFRPERQQGLLPPPFLPIFLRGRSKRSLLPNHPPSSRWKVAPGDANA